MKGPPVRVSPVCGSVLQGTLFLFVEDSGLVGPSQQIAVFRQLLVPVLRTVADSVGEVEAQLTARKFELRFNRGGFVLRHGTYNITHLSA
jgi:hypothetical protein